MITIGVKVVPGASRDRVVGWLGDDLKVTVAAPPESGKANAAVERLLTATFGSPARVVQGHSRPRKRVELSAITLDALRAAVAGLSQP